MGDTTITVSVHGGGGFGDKDFGASLSEQLAEEMGMKVVHEPGACAPCRANHDPLMVPFPGCNGNLAGRFGGSDGDDGGGPDPDDAKALAMGNLCRCKVVYVPKDGTDPDVY